MKQTELIMGMPITIEIVDEDVTAPDFTKVFAYFKEVDNRFSPYKRNSEISQINAGKIMPEAYSKDMKTVLQLCEDTRQETHGYFNIEHDGKLDPSGLVKGWAIYHASQMIMQAGFTNYYVNAGGDIQVHGKNTHHQPWQIGISNPFNQDEIVKVLAISDGAVATSGTYIRGQHIYNPHKIGKELNEIQSVTIIGDNIYDADRFATAVFAMGKRGMQLVESLPNIEAYMIDSKGKALYTDGFGKFVLAA